MIVSQALKPTVFFLDSASTPDNKRYIGQNCVKKPARDLPPNASGRRPPHGGVTNLTAQYNLLHMCLCDAAFRRAQGRHMARVKHPKNGSESRPCDGFNRLFRHRKCTS